LTTATATPPSEKGGDTDIATLAEGGRTNIIGFALRLAARIPFLFVAGRLYGAAAVGHFALAVVVVELAALIATLGMKRGLAQALSATDRPHAHVAWDALMVAFLASMVASGILFAAPGLMYAQGQPVGLARGLPAIVVAIAWSDISLAALAYRHNVRAAVTARAIIEPWTISIAATILYYVAPQSGLEIAYMLSMLVAMIASIIPFVRSYGLPTGWKPRLSTIVALATRNIPLAGADAIEWASRNVDRFIIGQLFAPAVVGVYYMAQQFASLPGRLKTSFDPILGPVIATSLARGDKHAVAKQIRQVGFWIMAAQGGIALALSIPGEAVMGTVGPQFVGGAAALAFLLTAEVAASTAAVSESGLVYVARHRNLIISAALLFFQTAISFALITVLRELGWSPAGQAAGPAIALLLSLTLASIIKSRLLSSILGAPVSGLRLPLVGAVVVSAAIGGAFTALPSQFEWVELLVGIPAILASYLLILRRWAFGPEDRALFKRVPQPA